MRQTEALQQILEKENRLETLMEEVIPSEVKEYVSSKRAQQENLHALLVK